MEKDRDFEFYLPHIPPLRHFSDASDNEVPVSFGKQQWNFERAVARVMQKAGAGFERVAGPLYSLSGSVSSFTPARWMPILQYLHEAGWIASPEFLYVPPYNDQPKVFMLSLKLTPFTNVFTGERIEKIIHGGTSFDFDEAAVTTIGEFIERRALAPDTHTQWISASPSELRKKGKKFLDPKELSGFSEEQKSRHPERICRDADVFCWVQGVSLFSGHTCFLPAQAAFWHYNYRAMGERLISESNSNGAAGMTSIEEALLNGLRELIQRDAFLMFWLHSTAPPRIDLDTIEDKEVREILAKLTRYGLEAEILDITSDFGLPTFAAFILEKKEGSYSAAMGASSQGNSDSAMKQSLLEALVMSNDRRKHLPHRLPESYRPFEDPIGHFDRNKLFANPDTFSHYTWFLSGSKKEIQTLRARYRAPENRADEFQFLLSELRSRGKGYELYYFASPHPVLKELGYHVVKVVVPALVPLYLTETAAPLGNLRLQNAPSILGFGKTSFPYPFPHPFP